MKTTWNTSRKTETKMPKMLSDNGAPRYAAAIWTPKPGAAPVSAQASKAIGRTLDYGRGKVREIILPNGRIVEVLDAEVQRVEGK